MKTFIDENKTLVAFYIMWVLLLFVTATITQGHSDEFWPVTSFASATDEYFSANFDFTEAIVYSSVPLVLFAVYNLLSNDKNT